MPPLFVFPRTFAQMPLDLPGQKNDIFVFDTPELLAIAAAERFVHYAQEAIVGGNLFSVSLAGGNTPRRIYELLATDRFKSRIDWSNVHLFFGDERCVPPDHPDSNYGMVHSALISQIPIPENNVHRVIGEGDPEGNAEMYERELQSFFARLLWPRFDLVLLGMGDDGHTASLFPGSDALNEKSRWVVKTRMERLSQDRITLTVPVFNHAARVSFLVTGSNKAQRLAQVLGGAADPQLLPAQAIHPVNGTLEWLIDRDAGALL